LYRTANKIPQQHFRAGSAKPGEVRIIRQTAPINLTVYYPKTKDGQAELAERVSELHTTAVTQQLQALNCPASQKLEILDALIKTVKEKHREQTE
jgi:hypothetical protein